MVSTRVRNTLAVGSAEQFDHAIFGHCIFTNIKTAGAAVFAKAVYGRKYISMEAYGFLATLIRRKNSMDYYHDSRLLPIVPGCCLENDTTKQISVYKINDLTSNIHYSII